MTMNWCFLTFVCILLLSPLLIEGNDIDEKNEAVKSLTAITNLFLKGKDTDFFRKMETVLIFPALLAYEVYVVYDFRNKNNLSDVAALAREIHIETNFTYFLDEFYHDLTAAAEDYYARKFAYLKFVNSVPVPDKNIADEESIRFAFKCFVKWYHDHPSGDAEEKAIAIPPILTMMTLNIHRVLPDTFQYKAWLPFHISEEETREGWAFQSFRTFGYAEFNFSQKCRARALRIKVSQQIAMVFVMPMRAEDMFCRALVTFFRALPDINLEKIDFKPQQLLVSIPIIKTSAVVNTAKHLEKIGLSYDIENEYNEIPSMSTRYLTMGLIFDPKEGADSQIRNAIPGNVTKFLVERPFFVAVLQAGNKVPLLLGLVQQPIADVDYNQIQNNIDFNYMPRNVPILEDPSKANSTPRWMN